MSDDGYVIVEMTKTEDERRELLKLATSSHERELLHHLLSSGRGVDEPWAKWLKQCALERPGFSAQVRAEHRMWPLNTKPLVRLAIWLATWKRDRARRKEAALLRKTVAKAAARRREKRGFDEQTNS